MTEADWYECRDPGLMLGLVRSRNNSVVPLKASSRKLRLFACACYRHVPELLAGERSLDAVVASEQFADGLCSGADLSRALHRVYELCEVWPTVQRVEAARAHAARMARDGLSERHYQCDLIRCIFGKPFHSRPIARPAWLLGNQGAARKLAETIYRERCFEVMPILADALEEAGCSNASILSHCRSLGPHARGCHVLDLLLGKK